MCGYIKREFTLVIIKNKCFHKEYAFIDLPKIYHVISIISNMFISSQYTDFHYLNKILNIPSFRQRIIIHFNHSRRFRDTFSTSNAEDISFFVISKSQRG